MHWKIIGLILLVITATVSADEIKFDNKSLDDNKTDNESPGIYPRQDNPLKGVGQKLQSGAQNLIKGVQHFVVGVLGAINNVNLQNEIGEAFQASAEETTTSEYYDEETTTIPTTTTTKKRLRSTVPPESTKAPIVETTKVTGYKIRRPKPTAPAPVINKVPSIPQYQPIVPQYPQYLPPYQQQVIPGYAPQYQPIYQPIQVQQQPIYQPIQVQQQPSINNNVQTISPAVQLQGQGVVASLPVVNQQNPSIVQESSLQNEQPLKSNAAQVVQVTLPPPTLAVQKVEPVTLPPEEISSTKKPNRLQQFSLNRKPSISQNVNKPNVAATKPSTVENKQVPASLPLGTVLRPNEPKYPIKLLKPTAVRTLRPLTQPAQKPQRPVLPPLPDLAPQPEEQTAAPVPVEVTEEGEEKEVTEETENVVDPDVETVVDDTKKQNKN